MSRLDIQALHKKFGSVEVLADIDLSVEDGAFTVFVGPSGCGKSTLLRLICGIDEVTSGVIAIDGEIVNDVPAAKRGIAMVFQTYALYPHMTVARNMGYALRLAGVSGDEIRRRVEAAADILKIRDYLDRKPRQLSGGQRQRVAIGRAIVREPRIFLFDEPLSNLDAALRVDMRFEFERLKQRLGTTMIYVTHDQVEAMTLADTIVVMDAGRIAQIGRPLDLYHAPKNRFVAGFIGSPRMNFLPVRDRHGTTLTVAGGRISAALAVDRDIAEIGIRPEDLSLADPGDGDLAGQVLASEHLGSDTFAHVDVDGIETPLLVRLAGDARADTDAPIGLTVAADKVHLFDRDGKTLGRAATAGSQAA